VVRINAASIRRRRFDTELHWLQRGDGREALAVARRTLFAHLGSR